MQFDITTQRLPKIYKRGNKDCYLDPVRKKLIYITPEETVRQKVISYLIDVLEPTEEFNVTVFQEMANNAIHEILKNGTLGGSSISSDYFEQVITKLESGTDYFFNVVVEDKSGNKYCYKPIKVQTKTA
mgnify:CR=1 FL=1